MNAALKALYILSWIPVAAIKIVLAALGLFVVPFAIWLDWPKVFWLWHNQEGVPGWWLRRSLLHWHTRYWPHWWWYAIRNPVNNARFIFADPGDVNIKTNWLADEPISMEAPEMVEAGQRMAYMWRWSGPFASYRRVWITKWPGLLLPSGNYSEIWFGWKVGSSVPGMGFTMQVRLNREIGA